MSQHPEKLRQGARGHEALTSGCPLTAPSPGHQDLENEPNSSQAHTGPQCTGISELAMVLGLSTAHDGSNPSSVAVGLWASHFTSLDLNFLILKQNNDITYHIRTECHNARKHTAGSQ